MLFLCFAMSSAMSRPRLCKYGQGLCHWAHPQPWSISLNRKIKISFLKMPKVQTSEIDFKKMLLVLAILPLAFIKMGVCISNLWWKIISLLGLALFQSNYGYFSYQFKHSNEFLSVSTVIFLVSPLLWPLSTHPWIFCAQSSPLLVCLLFL